MATTFKFGNGNWAVKEDLALAYNDENGNFKPLPFDFTRASTATRVNKDGLLETMDRGMPRIDFLDNTSGHLLLEPSRTNSFPRSNDFSTWSSNRLDLSSDNLISPDGSQNADKVAQQSGFTSAPNINYAGWTAGTYTISIFAKKGTWNYLAPSFNGVSYFNLNTGTIDTEHPNHSASIEYYGNGWYRCVIIATISTTTTAAFYFAEFNNTLTTTDTQGYMYIYGAQLEEGSYATSYIPTSGATVTRLADDVDTDYGSKNTLSDEVSVYFNLLPQVSTASNTNKCLSFGFNSSSNANSYAVLRFNGTNWSSRIQGTTGNNFDNLGISQTTEIKAVMVLTQSGYSIYANGSTSVASGSYGGTAPTINSVAFVEILNDTDDRGVYKIKELKVYNTALTEAEAQALTS